MLREMGMFQQAKEIGEKCLVEFADIDEKLKMAKTYNNLGLVYWKLGEYQKAIEYYDKALQIWKDKLGENHPNTKIVMDNIRIAKSNL